MSYFRRQNKTPRQLCSRLTAALGNSFLQNPPLPFHSLGQRADDSMIRVTSSGPLFRNSFLGVSFRAQGMVYVSQILSAGWGGWKCALKLSIKAFTLEAESLHCLAKWPPPPHN